MIKVKYLENGGTCAKFGNGKQLFQKRFFDISIPTKKLRTDEISGYPKIPRRAILSFALFTTYQEFRVLIDISNINMHEIMRLKIRETPAAMTSQDVILA